MLGKLKTLLGHTLIYGLGNYGIKVVGFALIPVYTRYLSPADYGVLSLVSMYTQAMFVMMNLGQTVGIFRFYYDHDDEKGRERVIAAAIWIVFLFSVPLSMVPLAFSPQIAGWLLDDRALWFLILLGTATVLAKVLLRMPFSIMRAKEQSRRYAKWSLIRSATATLIALVLVVGFHQGAAGVVGAQFVAEFAMCLFLTGATFKMLRSGFRWQDIKQQLAFGLPLVPAGVAAFALDLADRWFIRYYYTVADVGVYSLAYRFGEILLFIITAFQLSWGPFAYSHRRDPDAPALFAHLTSYLLAIYLFLWLGLASFAPDFIKIMAPEEYWGAATLIPVLALAMVFDGVMPMVNLGPAFTKRTILRTYTVLVAAGVNLVLNYLLIPTYGPAGAAWATFFAFTIQTTLALLVSLRLYPVPYQYGRIAIAAAAAFGLYGLTHLIPTEDPTTLLGTKSGLVILYPLALLWGGFFAKDDLERGLEIATTKYPALIPVLRTIGPFLRLPPPKDG